MADSERTQEPFEQFLALFNQLFESLLSLESTNTSPPLRPRSSHSPVPAPRRALDRYFGRFVGRTVTAQQREDIEAYMQLLR